MDALRRALIVLFVPFAAQAAISRVGHAFTGSSGGGSNSITRTYSPTTGNTVFVGVTTWTSGGQPTAPTITDGGTNTYTSIGTQFDASRSTCHLWRSSNVTGGSFTYTYSQTGNSWMNIFVVEYSGLANASQADGFTTGTGSAPTITSGTITTTHAADLLFAVLSEAESVVTTTFTATGGWAIVDQADPAVSTYGGVMEQIVSSTGTYAATATFSGSTALYAAMISATKGSGGASTTKVSGSVQ